MLGHIEILLREDAQSTKPFCKNWKANFLTLRRSGDMALPSRD